MNQDRLNIYLPLILLLGACSVGCDTINILPEQRVVVNGKEFFFREVESLRPVGEPFQEFVYDQGDFFIRSSHGAVRVNGIEITADSKGAKIANRHIALKADERLHFSSDMTWKVEGGASVLAPEIPNAKPVPASFKLESEEESNSP